MRKLLPLVSMFLLSSNTLASDFNLPFVNASQLGTLYADWATYANDASTAYTNPAGLVKLPYQQLVFAGVGLTGNTTFKGTAVTPPFPFPLTIQQTGRASSDIHAFMPSFYYALPINPQMTFALGVTAPFGLGTTYEKDSLVRYLATRSQVVGIDIGPSFGFKVNDYLAIGAGFDALHLSFTLNNMYGPPLSIPDAQLRNKEHGWGYGWHGGVLLDLDACTRIGFSYNSKIAIHAKGYSEVILPYPGPEFRTKDQKTHAILPERAQLSAQRDFTNRFTAMVTIFYTNWRTFKELTLQNTMTPFDITIPVTIPFNYHNTWDYAIGATFKATEQWLLRAGVMFMDTPSNNHDRGVADPIGKAVIVGLGAQYKQNAALQYEIGIAHSFFKNMPVDLTTPLTSLTGKTHAQTNLIGVQVTWNIC